MPLSRARNGPADGRERMREYCSELPNGQFPRPGEQASNKNKMAHFADDNRTIEKNSDKILAKLDLEYEFDEYQEMVMERRNEIDTIPYLILISTEENEYDMHCLNTADDVKNYITETLGEQSGWAISHIYHNGVEIEYNITVNLEE
jgi:hypothetical protein